MNFNEKDIKFLRSAKSYANEFVTCASKRKIGSIIVKNGRVVAEGVNGPPSGIDHLENRFIRIGNKAVAGIGWFYSKTINDWIKFLNVDNYIDSKYEVYNIKLAPGSMGEISSEYVKLHNEMNSIDDIDKQRVIGFEDENDKKGTIIEIAKETMCPRYLFGFQSGEQLDICGCVHAEENSIICCALNGISCQHTTLYCYCGVPCIRCTGKIINSGIVKVVCLDDGFPDYSPQSRIYFREAGVQLVQIPINLI